jgi:hypothetical protein
MSKPELDNLVRIHKLKLEPGRRAEFEGMVRSARTRLSDAQNESIDTDSQFDLAYGAAPSDGMTTPLQIKRSLMGPFRDGCWEQFAE